MLQELTRCVSGALSVPLLQRALNSSGRQERCGGSCSAHARCALGAVDAKAYRAWTWAKYKRVMKFAALIAGVHLLLILRDMESIYQQLVNVAMISQMICLFVLTLRLPPAWKIESHEWARWVIFSFSLGKIVMTWVLFVSDEHPGDSVVRVCKKWLDTITNMGIAVPTLAFADFSTGGWLAFLGLHISASAPFYVKWLNYNASLAVFKVVFIQVLSLLAYAAMERGKFKAYMKFQEQVLQRKLATNKDAPLPVSPQVGASTSHSTSAAENDAAASPGMERGAPTAEHGSLASHNAPISEPEAAASPSTEQPIGNILQELHQHEASASIEQPVSSTVQGLQLAQELRFTPKPYVSQFKKTKVMLKIHCDIGPDVLLTSPNINQLHSLLKPSLPGSLMVESAVRHGCVVVSMDLCEPVCIDDEASLLPSTAREHKIACKVAGSTMRWLHASGAQQLKDGTVLSIQVNNLIFRGCWSASTCSVQLFEDVQAVLSTKEQCSITLSEPAILLPALQPRQELESACMHGYSVSFCARVSTPTNDKLVGWQNNKGANHAVEGVEMEEKGVLQLLAHTRGIFLPVEATEICRADNGERTMQVSISLPGALQMDGQCFRLKLELVGSNKLLCSQGVLFMGSHLKEEQQELKGWAASNAHAPESVSIFLEDLAEFLSFQGLFAPSSISPPTVEGGDSSSSSSSFNLVDPEEGLLPLLKTEAQTPEMLHMMAEVGLELLQHAVSWGLTALAQRLLNGLMAEPLQLPFDTVASGQLPHAHSIAKDGGTQQQQQQQQQKVQERQKEWGDAAIFKLTQHVQPPVLSSGHASDPQLSGNSMQGQDIVVPSLFSTRSPQSHSLHGPPSLISCALLSFNKQCLTQVLEWGRKFGEPHSHAWPWDAVDGSGYSPIQIMARLPADHAILEQLLADTTARPAALQAQALARQRDGAQAGSGKPQGGEHAAVKQRCATSPPASSLAARPQHAYPNGVLKIALKALVFGFGKHGDINEPDYRDWCFESTAGYGAMWCRLVILIFSYTVVKCLYNGLLFNAVIVSLYPIPMFLALCANTTKRRKVYMTIGKIILWTLLLMFSMGVLPSVLFQKLTTLHLDWPVEVLMFRLMDQAQLGPLFLERVISCVSNTHMYTKLGFSFPLLRALALSLSSLLVGVTLDVRNRCIFLKIRALSAAGVRGSQRKVQKVE